MPARKATCRVCQHAQWVMTTHKTPRVDTAKCGTCTYPLADIKVPAVFYLVHMELARGTTYPRWIEWGRDLHCATFTKKETV